MMSLPPDRSKEGSLLLGGTARSAKGVVHSADDRAQALRLCRGCLLVTIGLAAAIVASFSWLSLAPLFSLEAVGQMGEFAASFFPPDLSPDFLARSGRAALETFAISAVATGLAALVGLILALPAAGRQGPGWRIAARFLLNLLRSVPELVWATLMVLVAGLGPFAGTLALAAHTAGVLGRLFAEALENAPAAPAEALAEAGAPPALAFIYGTLPGVLPQLVAYALYRWEMNIRMAAVLGFVGAGGLGQMLYFELSLFHQAEAATVIVAMLALAVLVDTASGILRRRLGTVHA